MIDVGYEVQEWTNRKRDGDEKRNDEKIAVNRTFGGNAKMAEKETMKRWIMHDEDEDEDEDGDEGLDG